MGEKIGMKLKICDKLITEGEPCFIKKRKNKNWGEIFKKEG